MASHLWCSMGSGIQPSIGTPITSALWGRNQRLLYGVTHTSTPNALITLRLYVGAIFLPSQAANPQHTKECPNTTISMESAQTCLPLHLKLLLEEQFQGSQNSITTTLFNNFGYWSYFFCVALWLNAQHTKSYVSNSAASKVKKEPNRQIVKPI